MNDKHIIYLCLIIGIIFVACIVRFYKPEPTITTNTNPKESSPI